MNQLQSSTSLWGLALLATLSSCSAQSSFKKEERPVEKIPITLFISSTGIFGAAGTDQLRGAKVAEQQINALGGVLGKQIELRVQDDASSAPAALAAANQALLDGVPLAIGPTGSESALELLPLVRQDKMLIISPSATSEKLNGDATALPFFRVAPSDSQQARGLAQLANFGPTSTPPYCPSIAILYTKNSYGDPIAQVLGERFKSRNIRVNPLIAMEASVEPPRAYRDYAENVLLRAPKCQAIIAPSDVGSQYMLAYAEAAKARGVEPSAIQALGSDALRQEAFITKSLASPAIPRGSSAAEGMLVVAPEPEAALFRQFETFFSAQFRETPGQGAASAYDAVIVMALAIERAGSATDLDRIRRAMFQVSTIGKPIFPETVADGLVAIRRGEDINYEGASGQVDFQPSGSVFSGFAVYQIAKGGFEKKRSFASSELQ
jgi:branched-chain amino acid transport system substrate-binding protein